MLRDTVTEYEYRPRSLLADREYPNGAAAAAPIKQRRDVNGMIVLGVVLLILGLLTGVGILWSVGVLLILIGAVLWILGAVGHQVGGRRHYY
jgi:hypothetical protein